MFVRELGTSIEKLKGVGKAAAAAFAALGVFSWSDLVTLYPRSYDDRTVLSSLNDIPPEGGTINTAISIQEFSHYLDGRRQRVLKIKARDLNSGKTLYLHCFGRAYLENAYQVGRSYYINAQVTHFKGSYNSSSFTLGESEEQAGLGQILPIYPLSGSLTQKTVRKAVDQILSNRYLTFDDEIPLYLIDKYHLMHTDEAIRTMHHPKDMSSLKKAKETLAFSELLYLELNLIREKGNLNKKRKQSTLSELEKRLIKSLPFSLTPDQERCLEEIRGDLDNGQMNRLLQGDVGSGKTLVAWISALHEINKGGQVAFMAPTELLARQHAEGAAQLLSPLGINVAFLTGDVKGKGRGYLLDALKRGDVDIAIGTHALFSKDVVYKNLTYAIIDEQHRFGVEQREALSQKGKKPSVLSMSATPIPRTLALTVFGSMDISTILMKPEGRKPIITHIVDEKNRERMYASIAVEFQRGHQAYFVYPRIDDEGESDLKDVTTMFTFLQQKYPGMPSRLIHSRLGEEEKIQILDDFKAGRLMYLVSTSVVEVGIDIPAATCMIIEHAERFGLAALHQLRGRVGRSDLQSYCFLVYYGNLSPEAIARLKIMRETNDGFRIAEADLAIRGPGEFVGSRQSGFLKLKVASLVDDVDMLETARMEAEQIMREDHGLISIKHDMLRKNLPHVFSNLS